MHQLVVRRGQVVDGTGAPARQADVAVDDGYITVVGEVQARGETELDATGHLVTPGWVDVHTHYDGQVTWESLVSPSCWHGVTTIVMGNCGVGFAPVAPDRHDWLIRLMEGVEDIPGTALHEGIRWGWETFPEYLDVLDRGTYSVDIATQVPHGALRAYVMGDRGADHDQVPSPEEIDRMGALAVEGIAAGALGFTTSRTENQRSSDGRFTPSLSASSSELLGIARAIGAGGQGVLSAVADFVDIDEEFALLRSMAEVSGRPLSISTMQVDARPDGWRRLLELITTSVEDGIAVRGQVASRAIGIMLGLTSTINPIASAPDFKTIADRPIEEQAELLRDPQRRQAILDQMEQRNRWPSQWERIFVLGDPPDYEPPESSSLAARAGAAGVSPGELAYDLLSSGDGRELLYLPFNNWGGGNLDGVREMLVHPYTVPGLGDAGAHCGLICDASFPTFLLAHWGRDRKVGRLPVEWLVRQQTKETADLVGLGDRGVLEPGRRGDLNVIDFDSLALHPPEVVNDLPAGGRRLIQRAEGYVATVVAGQVTMRDGQHTGSLPGRLVRGPRPEPSSNGSTPEQSR